MAHRLLRDPDGDGWERSDFPIVCETCLGPNPYVRMQRIEYGGTCHISGRPYTVFRWRPGNEARYKKTIICQEVAKAKNVCQVCLLDLDYGLPVQVRDTALGIENDDLPESDVGKEYQLNEQIKAGETESSFSQQRPNDLILQLQRTTPYYKRNQAPICTFFVRGQCNRGAECPYRHEMPTTGELAEQNIKDRYYGINDPVANKLLRRAGDMPKLISPEDQSMMTLYVGGLTAEITEDDIKDQFYHFGEIKSVKKIETRNCAFVTFSTRHAAERAAEELYNKLIVRGVRCKLDWGKPQANKEVQATTSEPDPMQPIKTTRLSAPQVGGSSSVPATAPNFFNLPGQGDRPIYPSMDPTAMGSVQPSSSGVKRQAEDSAQASSSGNDDKRARSADPSASQGGPGPGNAGLPIPSMQPHNGPGMPDPGAPHIPPPRPIMPPPSLPPPNAHMPPPSIPPPNMVPPPNMPSPHPTSSSMPPPSMPPPRLSNSSMPPPGMPPPDLSNQNGPHSMPSQPGRGPPPSLAPPSTGNLGARPGMSMPPPPPVGGGMRAPMAPPPPLMRPPPPMFNMAGMPPPPVQMGPPRPMMPPPTMNPLPPNPQTRPPVPGQ